MLKLHKPVGKQRWCGPTAISIIAGISTDEAARLIRQETGRRAVMGTHHWELEDVLDRLGYTMQTIFTVKEWRTDHLPNGRTKKFFKTSTTVMGITHTLPTLTKWLKMSKHMRTEGRLFLVSAGHHWVVISGRRACCSLTKDIVSIKDKKIKRRARVWSAYEVVRKAGYVPGLFTKRPTIAGRAVG